MAKFVIFFRYTSDTWKGLLAAPVDRTEAVAATFEAVGGRLLSLQYMLGPHDGFGIVELPDTVTMAGVAAVIAASGAYVHAETYPVLEPSDLVGALIDTADRAAAAYTAPGSHP